jgi:hypothetical protein
MIVGIFHSGSGLGNQLHRYVAARILAEDRGCLFAMVAPENFKGKEFMPLYVNPVMSRLFGYSTEASTGKVIPYNVKGEKMNVWEEKTNYFNPDYFFVDDHTVIDGEFQSEQYFGHRMREIDEWLKVEPIGVPDDVCVIGFRGGEFYVFPELGLPKSYFDEGIKMMKSINPEMKFEVHTDDEGLARKFFPDYKVIHNVGINWRSMRYAKYAIIANSSFYIFPRLLSGGMTIAPRGWARRNIGEWSRPDNYYRTFQYI